LLVLTACAANPPPPSRPTLSGEPVPSPVAASLAGIEPFRPPTADTLRNQLSTVPEASYFGRALAGEFRATQVRVLGPIVGIEADRLRETWSAFQLATGIRITYEGTRDVEKTASARLRDQSLRPDLVSFSQPSAVAELAARGEVLDLRPYLDQARLSANYPSNWLALAEMRDDQGRLIQAGVWQRANLKGLIWYPRAAWAAAGYPIPQTWEALIALMDQMVADDRIPWCIGIEYGSATGWAATDWLETLMLRMYPVEVYDRWVAGDLAFSSPEVRAAAERMAMIWTHEAYVFGGRYGIATTHVNDALLGLFDTPPNCWMMLQASFVETAFPYRARPGVDYDVFPFPRLSSEADDVQLVGGDLVVAFSDRPEVLAVVDYLTYAQNMQTWISRGGGYAPQRDVDPTWYRTDVSQRIGTLLITSALVRFDGSDLMPPPVANGSFWEQMILWSNNRVSLDEALQAIDGSWPK
jgi:alpha-glucoside transport system substrate-binding protein